ncbi:MAG TPA: DNA-binding response regulator [Lentisphaeria bacterium]|nr:MAG: DNA-binding response regulator [Lentisphaerae bacterium GWF2_50_93]HCE47011.1 DNA-binding response regulator [Lentisphaeria bacterium]
MKNITVLLADDHTVVRQGLQALLSCEKDIEVVGEAENGRQAVELARSLNPSVVVMDISMPMLNGTEAARQILQYVPSTKIIILSAHSSDDHISQVVASGAAGYLMKMTSAQNLAKAVREVWKGKTFFDSPAARRIHSQFQKSPVIGKLIKTRGSDLTSREMEVLQLVAEGLANKQIADELKISIKTVEKHRQQLKKKLHIQDTAGLTRYAIAQGVIEN